MDKSSSGFQGAVDFNLSTVLKCFSAEVKSGVHGAVCRCFRDLALDSKGYKKAIGWIRAGQHF